MSKYLLLLGKMLVIIAVIWQYNSNNDINYNNFRNLFNYSK